MVSTVTEATAYTCGYTFESPRDLQVRADRIDIKIY